MSFDNTTAVQVTNSLLKGRFSCRYYTHEAVSRETIEEIIDAARHAPSASNIQPWSKVYVLTGDALRKVTTDVVDAYHNVPDAQCEYDFFPPQLPSSYSERRQIWGAGFYGAMDVARDDVVGRKREEVRNFQFYGAPVAFVFTVDKGLNQSSWLDIGYFMQSITIAARARGLETCSQQSTAIYYEVLKRHLSLGDNEMVLLGMAVGHPDLDKVSRYYYKPKTREVADITSFHGF